MQYEEVKKVENDFKEKIKDERKKVKESDIFSVNFSLHYGPYP